MIRKVIGLPAKYIEFGFYGNIIEFKVHDGHFCEQVSLSNGILWGFFTLIFMSLFGEMIVRIRQDI